MSELFDNGELEPLPPRVHLVDNWEISKILNKINLLEKENEKLRKVVEATKEHLFGESSYETSISALEQALKELEDK